MDLSIKKRSAGGGEDLSWLGSRHGVANARPITLKAEAFTDKTVKSGQPLELDSEGFAVPYAGSNPLLGFSIDGADVENGDVTVALLDHGRVLVDNLPVEFTVPNNTGQFVFVKEA